MSLDSVKDPVGNLVSLLEVFQALELVLELFVFLVERGNHLSHVADGV